MVSPNERCFNDTSAKDIWLPCALNGGTTAGLHIDEEARFQAHYTIIADRDTGTHADLRFATLTRASGDQQPIVSEAIFVSRHSGTPIALFTGNRPALLSANYWGLGPAAKRTKKDAQTRSNPSGA
jgi:hypothetical protein